ncbi:AcrR family transcriptional regulator [Actinoalloteichus hoggarensis]|uniref:Transcriptional regulator BetI n=1 Tax=Actinoalloteichus hoggarensis TaxID=1470176 RepID=A0A221W3R0_9PSEU|nr:TetR family transcriptional regulator [Actinoalloteichus hoggarensis]ASO20287.1 transcriptional regulator BetI [Actinoalloteichus hoggarensis]MBB5918999.1 AcrR family transcriptional regulator [Actinoalloteichus hoggarensis]
MAPSDPPTLRERRQQRVRESIITAARELFAEHGFDQVTVTDIAARAEVGRATFFRYFGDKQEVVFAAEGGKSMTAEATHTPAPEAIGDSLPAALAYVRRVVVAFTAELVEDPEAYTEHERLVAEQPELLARSLTKQRRHVTELVELLTDNGAEPATASLAAELGIACFHAGRTAADDEPSRLTAAVDAAFARLA